MSQATISDSNWSIGLTNDGTSATKSVKIETKDTFLDKDIIVSTTMSAGTLSAEAPTVTGGSATMTAHGITTADSSDYYIDLATTNGSAKSNAKITAGGYLAANTTKTNTSATAVSVSGNGSKVYIKPSAITGETDIVPSENTQTVTISEGYTPGATITVQGMSGGSTTQASFTGGTTTVNASNIITRGKYTNTGGYAGATTTASPRLAAAEFGNTPASGKTDASYVDISEAKTSASGPYAVPILTSGGNLYINKGYVDDLKISLAHLVPDTLTGGAEFAAADKMLQGYAAFDADGAQITGTIGNASIKANNATATIGSPTWNSTNSDFTLSASGTTTAEVATNGAGYVSSTAGTFTNGSISGTKSLPVIELKNTVSGTTKVTPTLAKGSKDSGDTWVDAADSAAATTTKPTSNPYVKVTAAAAANTLTITPSITSAGYGNSSHFNKNSANTDTVSVGSNAASPLYVPIKKGTAPTCSISDLNIGTSSTVDGTVSATQPSSGYYIELYADYDLSGGATGWIDASALSDEGEEIIYYSIATAGAPTISDTGTLHSNGSSHAGYDYLAIKATAKAGYNRAADQSSEAHIAVFQGNYTVQ